MPDSPSPGRSRATVPLSHPALPVSPPTRTCLAPGQRSRRVARRGGAAGGCRGTREGGQREEKCFFRNSDTPPLRVSTAAAASSVLPAPSSLPTWPLYVCRGCLPCSTRKIGARVRAQHGHVAHSQVHQHLRWKGSESRREERVAPRQTPSTSRKAPGACTSGARARTEAVLRLPR
jgi:hypothetical protein